MSVEVDLPAFIRQHFRSVWALEILLLLRRAPARAWPASEIVRELRASIQLVNANLEQFKCAGLVAADADGFRFAPASPAMAQLCETLREAYLERPVTVINLISAPDDRLQALADAFRFSGRRR